MKTKRSLLLLAGVLPLVAAPAEARGQRSGGPGTSERSGTGLFEREGAKAPALGLQLSSGLQMSAPLNGSGPAPVAVRLNDDEWQKLFVRRTAAK